MVLYWFNNHELKLFYSFRAMWKSSLCNRVTAKAIGKKRENNFNFKNSLGGKGGKKWNARRLWFSSWSGSETTGTEGQVVGVRRVQVKITPLGNIRTYDWTRKKRAKTTRHEIKTSFFHPPSVQTLSALLDNIFSDDKVFRNKFNEPDHVIHIKCKDEHKWNYITSFCCLFYFFLESGS